MTVLDYEELNAVESEIVKRRPPHSEKNYGVWAKYHDALCGVLSKYGKEGWDADVDFYHGGDWFHELADGFALRTPKSVRILSLRGINELQKVISQHHSDALLSLGGEMDSPYYGSSFLITGTAAYGAWYNSTAPVCRQKFEGVGIKI